MIYLHKSVFQSHGYLSSANCRVDNRWVLKITGFALHAFGNRYCTEEVFTNFFSNRCNSFHISVMHLQMLLESQSAEIEQILCSCRPNGHVPCSEVIISDVSNQIKVLSRILPNCQYLSIAERLPRRTSANLVYSSGDMAITYLITGCHYNVSQL